MDSLDDLNGSNVLLARDWSDRVAVDATVRKLSQRRQRMCHNAGSRPRADWRRGSHKLARRIHRIRLTGWCFSITLTLLVLQR